MTVPQQTGSGHAGTVIEGNPIINDAFTEPTRYWHFGSVIPEIRDGRRTAGYLAPSPDGQLKITDEVIPLKSSTTCVTGCGSGGQTATPA